MRVVQRMLLFLLFWGVATGVMGAPMWAGWMGALIIAYLAVPERA